MVSVIIYVLPVLITDVVSDNEITLADNETRNVVTAIQVAGGRWQVAGCCVCEQTAGRDLFCRGNLKVREEQAEDV